MRGNNAIPLPHPTVPTGSGRRSKKCRDAKITLAKSIAGKNPRLLLKPPNTPPLNSVSSNKATEIPDKVALKSRFTHSPAVWSKFATLAPLATATIAKTASDAKPHKNPHPNNFHSGACGRRQPISLHETIPIPRAHGHKPANASSNIARFTYR